MQAVVAPGCRVKQNRKIYEAGEVLPAYDQVLVDAGYAIAVEAEETVEVEVNSEDDLDDAGSAENSADGEGKTNLNTASEEELVKLDYIGPAIAVKLIGARPFATLADAQAASGLSDPKWERLQPKVCL